MPENDALNALLDRLAATTDRDAQVALLRTWTAALYGAWERAHESRERETLGKLGGG